MLKSMINPDLSGKKIVIIVLLSIALTSLLLAEEPKVEEISLDDLLTNYLPDYDIIKQIQLEGIGRDFAVAKETGEIVAVTEIGNLFKVYFLDKIGNLQWEKEISGKGYETKCSISDNGKAIVITNYISEDALNTVLDNSGNILFERKLKDIKLKPIPNGQFFYEEIGMMANREKGVYIYDRSGDEIELTGFDFSNKKDIRLEFLNNRQIIAYMDKKFVFFEYFNGYFKSVWNYQLTEEESMGHFFHDSILINNERIFISHHRLKLKTIVFSYNGEIIHSEKNYYDSFSYLNNKELVVYSNSINGVIHKLVNFDTDDTVELSNPSIFNSMKKGKYFENAIKIDQAIFYTIRRFSWDKENFSTLITPLGCYNLNTSYYHFQMNDSILKLFKENYGVAELILLGGNYEN